MWISEDHSAVHVDDLEAECQRVPDLRRRDVTSGPVRDHHGDVWRADGGRLRPGGIHLTKHKQHIKVVYTDDFEKFLLNIFFECNKFRLTLQKTLSFVTVWIHLRAEPFTSHYLSWLERNFEPFTVNRVLAVFRRTHKGIICFWLGLFYSLLL